MTENPCRFETFKIPPEPSLISVTFSTCIPLPLSDIIYRPGEYETTISEVNRELRYYHLFTLVAIVVAGVSPLSVVFITLGMIQTYVNVWVFAPWVLALMLEGLSRVWKFQSERRAVEILHRDNKNIYAWLGFEIAQTHSGSLCYNVRIQR
jgi:hypothetical protein